MKRRDRRAFMPAVLLLLAGLLVWSAAPALAEYSSYDSLTFAVVGGRPLHLSLRIPAGASAAHPVPCVVWIHGGGWIGGGALPVPGLALRLVAERNIAVASVEYRLTSQAALFGGEPVIFPAQIHDVKGAVRWLRANAATYGLDPTRFGAWGSSAGGHLAALLGTSAGIARLEGTVGGNPEQSSSVRAFADYFGPTDLLNMNLLVTTPPGSTIDHDAPSSPESHLVGWDHTGQGIGDIRAHQGSSTPPYPLLLARTLDANPITHVDPTDPPAFIAHGDDDTVVPLGSSRLLDEALSGAGVFHVYRVVPGAGHGALGLATDNAATDFLASQLTPATSVEERGGAGVSNSRLSAWPNPSDGHLVLTGEAAFAGTIVDVYDIAGRRVRSLALGADGLARWDGCLADGAPVAAGVYLARIRVAPVGGPVTRIAILH